jgi:hypothetical protein
MIETGAGVRRPWLGRSFAEAGNRVEQGDGDREEEDEKWRQREKWLGLTVGSLFNSGGNKGTRNGPPGCA